jgi:branched-chain amino acid transport system ATP-binding protein
MKPLLDIRGLKVAYGGINAIKGIDLHVAEGEMVALIGANGAGKTTTLNAICGLLMQVEGQILFDQQNIWRQPTHALVRLGLALVPEGRGIFGRLTVGENLAMGAYVRSDTVAVSDDLQRVCELFPRLAERRGQLAGTLSGGEQQMLAIGRALMCRPRMLLLDEPSMGLAPMMVEKIFDTIRRVAREGVTVLLVEQNAKLALEMSQRGYVIESGVVTLEGDAAQLLSNSRVREAYLGESL